MSTFPPVPKSFRLIDQTNWGEYYYIAASDVCLYIWERMSKVKAGEWHQYPANGLIANLQIPLSAQTENPYRFKHKGSAIRYAAQALSPLLGNLKHAGTFVPVPPSKRKGDPEHDDRLSKVLQLAGVQDARELVLLHNTVDAKQKGLRPQERAENYRINEHVAGAAPTPGTIFVFDDVLTTGSHFKAMEIVLAARFPGVPIVGVFLARAVRPPEDDVLSI